MAMAALALGSFFAAIVERSASGGTALAGRSACRSCGTRIAAYDLVPVLSWVVLRGRCRQCQAAIPSLHPTLELLAPLVVVTASLVLTGAALGFGIFLGLTLLLLAAFDLRQRILPLPLTIALGLAGLARAAATEAPSPKAAVAGWIAGFALLWLVKALYRRLRGRDGLGGGDLWLFAASGAWVGVDGLPPALLIGAGAMLLAVAACQSLGRKVSAEAHLPLGCGLAFGTWAVFLCAAS